MQYWNVSNGFSVHESLPICISFLNKSVTFCLLPSKLDSKCLQRWTKRWLQSVFHQPCLTKCFPNFSLVTLHLPDPLTQHKGVGVRIGTSIVTQHHSLSRTGWCILFKPIRVIMSSPKDISIFMYFFFVFQNNGSLAWCQNHKQCSKVCPSPPSPPPHLSYLVTFNLLSVD